MTDHGYARKRLFKIVMIYYEFNVKRRCALTSDSTYVAL